MESADQQLRFAERIANPQAISSQELSHRRYAEKIATARLLEGKAAIAVAEAEIGSVQTDIERSTVRAPVAARPTAIKQFFGGAAT